MRRVVPSKLASSTRPTVSPWKVTGSPTLGASPSWLIRLMRSPSAPAGETGGWSLTSNSRASISLWPGSSWM